MAKMLVWPLRVALLLLTPVFLFCAAATRTMMWLDAWASDQLIPQPALASRKLQLVPPQPPEERTGTERGTR